MCMLMLEVNHMLFSSITFFFFFKIYFGEVWGGVDSLLNVQGAQCGLDFMT